MLNQGWQNAFTASLLAFLILVVIPKACGNRQVADEEVVEATECYILWDGREYVVDCSTDEAALEERDDEFESAEP